jgi:hypothetical protein
LLSEVIAFTKHRYALAHGVRRSVAAAFADDVRVLLESGQHTEAGERHLAFLVAHERGDESAAS